MSRRKASSPLSHRERLWVRGLLIIEAKDHAKAVLPDPPLELLPSEDIIPLEETSTEINIEKF